MSRAQKSFRRFSGRVRGPFIQYNCSSCGALVSANAPRNPDRLVDTIAELNGDVGKRVCASCWHPEKTKGKAQ
jgi:hypothetical protein